MSTIVLSGDTSGTITLDAPAVAGTNTILFPALTGTVLTNKTVGTVLQVVTATDAGGSTTSTTPVNLNVAAINITPTSTSSRLVLQVSFQGIITAAGSGTNSSGSYQINEGAILRSLTAISIGVASGGGTNVQTSSGLCLIASVTNSALTVRSFNLFGASNTGSATCFGISMTWTITEVAA